MPSPSFFENLFLALPDLNAHHAHGTNTYVFLKQIIRKEVENLFSSSETLGREFKPFGELIFPYYKMGAIDSMNLFDLDELIIFSFYWINRKKYQCVVDIGANIGLHSIILNKCGFKVRAYEPDPKHFEILQRNLSLSNCSDVDTFNMAVSNKAGVMEFVRVLGNTTGSHLAGSKANPYGDLERFPVKVESIASIIKGADLVKLDAEGHEKEIILTTNLNHWLNTDALVEVENKDNAVAIYEHFKKLGVQLFSQKINWKQVRDAGDMPTSYREGTLFATCRSEMPW